MMSQRYALLVIILLSAVTSRVGAQSYNPATAGGYSARSLTIPKRYLRVDLAPADYGYMDHGVINNDRGMKLGVWEADDVSLNLGAGAAYGILDEFEIGGLLFPFLFYPDFDFGDMELYGRYAFLQGKAQLAFQFTMQIPTNTDFAIGIGLPARFTIGSSARIDTGLELELIFADDAVVNLDIPFALSFDVGDSGFLGLRSGLFLPDMEELAVNLGVQGGFNVDGTVDLSASFNWPGFLWTGPGDAINPDTFEIVVGASIFVDI
ncbi:MAG: hypothetical protein JXA30_00570 [Deltaproteobacteria bacterium]|nr:hypothetical protein [Deltaproteobacteria bacterium]